MDRAGELGAGDRDKRRLAGNKTARCVQQGAPKRISGLRPPTTQRAELIVFFFVCPPEGGLGSSWLKRTIFFFLLQFILCIPVFILK